jgi:hypothetical protein
VNVIDDGGRVEVGYPSRETIGTEGLLGSGQLGALEGPQSCLFWWCIFWVRRVLRGLYKSLTEGVMDGLVIYLLPPS